MALRAREWTVDDLAKMPDDGQRYEVIDGELFVTPSPAMRHQDAIGQLHLALAPFLASQGIGWAVFAPADVTFSPRRGVQPDLFVVPLVNGQRPKVLADIRDLLLVVEVTSPSSAKADRVNKRALYRDEGVDEYWVVDLDARVVERTTPHGDRVEVLTSSIEWQPRGAAAPLTIDLSRYFATVLDG